MKLSKIMLLVIAAGAFIIIAAALGVMAFGRVSEQDKLNEELTLAQSNLERVLQGTLSSQQKELEGQLSQATLQFEAVKAMLSQAVGNVAASSILFDIAKGHGLEVTELASPGLSSDSLEEITCSVMSLSATVEGEIPDLVSFITTLNTYFTTGVIKSVTITIPEDTSEDKASADIQLVVYTYQGD